MKTRMLFTLALMAILALGSMSVHSLIPDDADGDGVPDSVDVCDGEDASFFDRDGDGCLDVDLGARHTEYWGTTDTVITYVINVSGSPDVGDGSEFNALQAAMDLWPAVPGTELTVTYGGTSPIEDANILDQVNLVTFVDDEYNFSSLVLAVGITTSFTEATWHNGRLYRAGEIVDGDMIFNPVKAFKTSSSGPAYGTDIQGVATHEAGHIYGLAHTTIRSATMSYVLPAGTAARSLEADDELAYLKAYADPATRSAANRIGGTVTDGQTTGPVPGAVVFAVSTAGDTAACDYTLPDGSYTFLGLDDGDYYIAIHPLNGTSPIAFIQPGNINALVETTAVDFFLPEYWDAAESNTDDSAAKTAVNVAAGSSAIADLITNIDAAQPVVVSAIPPDDSVGVAVDGAYMIRFSEAIDTGTLLANFSFTRIPDGAGVGGHLNVLSDDSLIAFTPGSPLDFETDYQLVLDTLLLDKSGNQLAVPFVLDVTTEMEPPLSVSSLSPNKGVVNATVVINGRGFDTMPFPVVEFDTVLATVTTATPNQLVVTVPSNANTGPVKVTNTSDSAESNLLTFTLLSSVEIARGYETGVAQLDNPPTSIVLMPDDSYAYVGTEGGAEAVVIDPAASDFLSSESIVYSGSIDGIATIPSARRVYGVSSERNELVEIMSDTTTGFLFNTVLSSRDLDARPYGIAIEPGGHWAYIPTDEAEIQVWDVQLGSATYQRQVNAILSPGGASLRGEMAVTPDGENLLALTDAGDLHIFDIGPDTLLQTVNVGFDPRDVIVDPAGQRAYVSHDNGDVSVVAIRFAASPSFEVMDIAAGSSLRGIDITPGATYVYASDRQLDEIKVVDMDENSPTWRSVITDITQEYNPVAIELSSDGVYGFSILQGSGPTSPRLIVTTIGLGPTLATIYPPAAPPGATVVLSGADLGDDFNSIFVDFNGTEVVPDQPRFVGQKLLATVPLGATTGPVKVTKIEDTPPHESATSNEVFFRVLDETPPGGLRFAGQIGIDPGEELRNTISISPSGDLAFVGGASGRVHIFDIRPGSENFHRLIRTVDVFDPGPTSDVALTADGRSLFMVSDTDLNVPYMSARQSASDFGKLQGSVDFDVYSVDNPNLVVTSPDNRWVLIYDMGVNAVNVVDATGLQDGVTPVVVAQATLTNVVDMVFHPSSLRAYLARVTPDEIWVLNVNAGDGNFGLLDDSEPMPTPFAIPAHAPLGLDVLPDGSRLLVNAFTTGGPASHELIEFSLPDPSAARDTISGGNQWILGTAGTNPGFPLPMRVSPRGDYAIWSMHNFGMSYYEYGQDPALIVSNEAFNVSAEPFDFAFTPDGTRVYFAAAQSFDSLLVYDFVEAQTMVIVSGEFQNGVVGQALAAPLRVRVTTTTGGSLEGVALEFSATAGNGQFVTATGAQQSLVVATDAGGYAQATWRLGPGTGIQFCLVSAPGLTGSPLAFEATATDDPASLPLQLSQVIPLNGTGSHSVTTAMQATFSRGVLPSTIVDTTLSIRQGTGGPAVPVAYGFTDGDRRVSLTPLNPLNYGQSYEIVFDAAIGDTSGGFLTNPQTTTFSTQATAPTPTISALNPPSGVIGINLTVSGNGFDPVLTNNTVLFNGAEATPIAGSVDFLRVQVPRDAITGDVSVATATDTSNARPFTVLVPSSSPIDDIIANIGVGGGTGALAVTPNGELALTVSTDGDVVIPMSLDSLLSLPVIPVGDQPVAVAVHPEGTFAYVANFGSGSLSVIDLLADPLAVVQTLIVGTNPIDVAASDDRIFVANAGSSNISVIDGDSSSATHHAVLATIGVGGGAKGLVVSPDGTRLYVGGNTGFIVMQVSDFSVLATIGVGGGAKGLVVSPDGTLLYVLTNGGDVVVYNVEPNSVGENSVLATIGVGGGAKGLVVSPDGTLLYLVQENSDQVLVVDITVVGGASALESPGFTISYSVKDTVMTGQDPSAVAFDPSGSGVAIIAQAGETDVIVLNASPFPQGPLTADVEVRPNTLNLQSNGKWVSGWVELPNAYAPEEIDLSTVLLQDTVPPVPGKSEIKDSDGDGVRELHMKFDRALFQQVLPQGEFVDVQITGGVRDKLFAGCDTIRTIRPTVTAPRAGEHIAPEVATVILWDSPDGYNVHHADVHFSDDDGETWSVVTQGIPDTGYLAWTTPNLISSKCRIMVTLFSNETDVLGMGMSAETFAVTIPLSVALTSFDASVEEGTALLRWKTGIEVGAVGFHLVRSNERDGEYARVTEEMIPARGGGYGSKYEYRDETVRPNVTYYYKLQELVERGPGMEFGPYEVSYRLTNDLAQNVPNPFNPTTTIRFSIASKEHVQLIVYDVAGRRVATLVDERRPADIYKITWDGFNDSGERVASGVYFYRLRAGKFTSTKKMLLLK